MRDRAIRRHHAQRIKRNRQRWLERKRGRVLRTSYWTMCGLPEPYRPELFQTKCRCHYCRKFVAPQLRRLMEAERDEQ